MSSVRLRLGYCFVGVIVVSWLLDFSLACKLGFCYAVCGGVVDFSWFVCGCSLLVVNWLFFACLTGFVTAICCLSICSLWFIV